MRRKQHPRGTVIVLVVAVLALLAVIGTVYIVSARTERNTATVMQSALNLNYAVDAINRIVAQKIGDENLDGQGIVGGYMSVGPYGTQTSRNYEIPEYNQGELTANHRDNEWLASNLYRTSQNSFTNPYGPDLTYLTSAAFDPSSGQFNIPWSVNPPLCRVVSNPLPSANVLPNGATEQVPDDALMNYLPYSDASGIRYRYGIRVIDTSRMVNVNVGEARAGWTSVFDYYGSYYGSYSIAHPAVFDGADNSKYATADSMTALDTPLGRRGTWNFTSPTYGYFDPTSGAAPGSTLSGSTPLEWAWPRQMLLSDRPNLSVDALGRGINPFDIGDELEIRSYAGMGTSSIPRAASALVADFWPNNLGNINFNVGPPAVLSVPNYRRDNFTVWSYSRELRSFPYTAFPFEIDPMVPSQVPFTLTPVTNPQSWPWAGTNVWPSYPARVSANPDISYYVADPTLGFAQLTDAKAADMLAIAATNIASAMERLCGYTHAEACAFAANYITFRWNGWKKVTYGGVDAYGLIDGPSFVDSQGICLRASTAGGLAYSVNYGINPSDLVAETTGAATTNKIYLGYAAQPFINEVACHEHQDPTPKALIDEAAVELYNPYNVALDLSDYVIRVGDPTNPLDIAAGGAHADIPLTNQYIPARGYFVLYSNNGAFDFSTKIAGTAQKMSAANFNLIFTGGKAVLLRKYVTRANTVAYAAVDSYDYTAAATQAAATGADQEMYYERRDNDDKPENTVVPVGDPAYLDHPSWISYKGRWLAAVQYPTTATASHGPDTGMGTELMTLGAPNPNPDPLAVPKEVGLPLFDRYAEVYPGLGNQTGFAVFPQRSLLLNVSEFNHIVRIANEVNSDPATSSGSPVAIAAPTDNGVISQQIAARLLAPDGQVAESQCPSDAMFHFDFMTPPWDYNNSDVPSSLPAPVGMHAGDPRAMRLLDCLAFVDRASDYSIDFGDSAVPLGQPHGLSKIRIPGQINVNTASPQVLATLARFNTPGSYHYIGDIMAYRWRCKHDDVRIPVGVQDNSLPARDFDDLTKYPGYGIHSLGELMIPLTLDTSTATTLDDRDQIWAQVYNVATVRSDTFVVYAYLEAIKANPKYAGGHNNGTDWYVGGVTDDPSDGSQPNLRLARKRWVALVDRSNSNFNRGLIGGTLNPAYVPPRVIAVKDLQQ